MGDPTSSYATAGIALRLSGALKPHHHDKVETPSVGHDKIRTSKHMTPSRSSEHYTSVAVYINKIVLKLKKTGILS
jgi:hypothetical protein